MNSNITAIILTKNEERNIAACLKALSFCAERIIIDDYSSDNTARIATKNGARVIRRRLNNNFAKQRNIGLTYAKHEWCLYIDADEIVSKKLQNEIIANVKSDMFDAYNIPRSDFFLNRKLVGGEFNINLIRLGKKSAGKWIGSVHEKWNISKKVGYCRNEIVHYSHESISQFISQVSKYAESHTLEKARNLKRVHFYQVILYPPLKFINNYIFKKGYRDGTHGFVSNMMMSLHSFLAWSALWLNQH